MKRWWSWALLGSLLCAGSAQAQGYVESSAGASTFPWLDVSGIAYRLNTGYNLGASAGLKLTNLFGPHWDLRGDVFYTHAQYSCCSSHLGGISFMGDLIYHFDVDWRIKPYVGAGVGAVAIQYGNPRLGPQVSNVRFAGQAIAGAEYPITSRFSAFAEYRFIDANKANFTVPGPVQYRSHNFTIGLKLSL